MDIVRQEDNLRTFAHAGCSSENSGSARVLTRQSDISQETTGIASCRHRGDMPEGMVPASGRAAC